MYATIFLAFPDVPVSTTTKFFSVNYKVNVAMCNVAAGFIYSMDTFDNFHQTTPPLLILKKVRVGLIKSIRK